MGTQHRRGTIPSVLAGVARPGELIGGKYRVEAVVGRGGMSVVLRATHVELDREVAIKVVSPTALLFPEHATRLRAEARVASRLRSEHVVRVYDVGRIAGCGVPYLVMEYLQGADLGQVLARRGPMPLHLACECVLQACEALAEAHAAGIVHRDLKPANLFLTGDRDGAPLVKVLDFGISRSVSRAGPSTDPGIVLGTPAYMAPEQMEGKEPLDARADIWALGTILYELVVGEPAFSGDSLPQVFVSILRAPAPRPSRVRRDVPPLLDAVVARCLAFEPDDRYPDVVALARDLGRVAARASAPAERVARALGRSQDVAASSRAGRRARYGAAAALSITVGGALGFGATSAISALPASRDRAEVAPLSASSEPLRPPVLDALPRVEIDLVAGPERDGDGGLAAVPAVPVTAGSLP